MPTLVLLAFLPGCVRDYVFDKLEPRPIDVGAAPAGLSSTDAATCGACHTEIFAEWSTSRMGQAWTDPVFQADFAQENEMFFCRHCHTPLTVQQPTIVSGLRSVVPVEPYEEPNPDFDPDQLAHGVTCVACHLTDGALLGPHGVTAPHATRTTTALGDGEACARCHQLQAPPFSRMDRPSEDTVGEWLRWKSETGRTESCQDCHMPRIERPIALGGSPRTGRQHTFPGAWDERFVASALDVGITREAATVTVAIENRAGHHVPTGEPARAIEVRIVVRDLAGKALVERTEWLERKVEGYHEVSDTTLRPAETRRINLSEPTPGSAPHNIEVDILFHRVKNLPHTAAAAGDDATDRLLHRTVSWASPTVATPEP